MGVRGNDFPVLISLPSFKCSFKGEIIMMRKIITVATDVSW